MKRQTVSNRLLGRTIQKRDDWHAGNWPWNDPNLSGQHIAVIEAIWVEDGSLKAFAKTPSGLTGELWLTDALLVD